MGKLVVGVARILPLCAVLLFPAFETAYSAPADAQWVIGSPMVSAHGNIALVTLLDGRLLAVSGSDGVRLTTVAEVYNPATGLWTQTGSTNQGRNAFRPPILLHNGKVLIAGGHDQNVVDYATAELYDPATGLWSYTGNLNTSRRYTVLVGLQDGRVLAATGAHGPPDGSRFLSTAELYDPATGQWTFTASALIQRESASGILLNDGRVLLLGGYSCCDVFQSVTELYDPVSGTWSRAGDLPSGRSGAVLVVLPDGRVLAAGGGSNVSNGPLTETLLFNPATAQWSRTDNLNFARSGASAVLLQNGKVLIAGGGPLESELYDPATGTWTVDASLAFGHNGGTMALLPNGNVLMAGGGTGIEGTLTEIYEQPPQIIRFETFREGVLVFFRLIFTDPSNIAAGFGFKGVKGSGWAEENHLFSSPSYGRVYTNIVEYPFNHLCGQPGAYESDVEAWISDNTGRRTPSVTIHLACSAQPAPVPATVETKIFAGYAATGSQAHPIDYKKMSATWDVPVVLNLCSEITDSSSATWPGIADSVNPTSLVQAGTVSGCQGKWPVYLPVYWAFWQVFNKGQTAGPQRILTLPIFPLNKVKVEITSNSNGEFSIDIWNLTLGLHWQQMVLGDNSPKATAVAVCLQELPPPLTVLSHFSSVTITCTANDLPIGSAGDITLKAIMPKMKTGDLSVSGAGDTFTIDWVSP